MLRTIIYLIAILILSTSCNNSNKVIYLLKDSILKEHLSVLDSLPYYDTTDINYKVLKAYQKNDTNFFKKLHFDILKTKERQHERETIDSCIQQTKIEDLNCDEVYRFIYSGAFCPYRQITTVSKKGGDIKLNFELYQEKSNSANCKKIDEFDKKISLQNWDDIKKQIEKGDVWGLKRENGIHGFDGSTLIVIGYIREGHIHNKEMKFNYVSRWVYSTLKDAFELTTKISGNNQGCFQIK